MRSKISLIIISVMLTGFSLLAQPSLDSLLSQVERGNPSLMTAQNLLEARQLEARTGLTPSNPEVEFGYMWGNPTELGNRTDFEVTQSFDFPTAYSSRSKLSKISQQQAELEYKAVRQEIMKKAHKVWITRVYLNRMESMLNGRFSYARKVYDGFEQKLESGEANQLQVNQARMKVMALENEISQLQRELSKSDAEVVNLTANDKLIISDTLFPVPSKIIYDTLVLDYMAGNVNQLYQSEVDKKAKEVDVVFNQKLPKLKAGYYSERILDVKLQGVKAGISIPLWGNAKAVNSAKAKLAYAESDAERYWQVQQNELKQNYDQWVLTMERVTGLEEMLKVSNDEALLRRAMEAGEISLTEYFYESDFYFQNVINLLEFKKEMFLLEVELRKVYY